MNEIKTYFGKNLKKIRKLKGYSQEALAEKIGIYRRQLTRIETGKSFPSVNTLDNICEALEISPYTLFDFSDFCELKRTGTDNELYYAAQKHSGNIIILEEKRAKIQTAKNKIDSPDPKSIKIEGEESIIKMAKTLNKSIFVEYYKNNIIFRSVLYNPDGTFTVKSGENQKEILLKEINNNIKKYENSIPQLEFINLAIECLKNKKSIEKMQNVLSGMLL